jgi:hypothetical protein
MGYKRKEDMLKELKAEHLFEKIILYIKSVYCAMFAEGTLTDFLNCWRIMDHMD